VAELVVVVVVAVAVVMGKLLGFKSYGKNTQPDTERKILI
jgi:hypothetical protein